jgi:LacI family transcriptional regulator
MIDNRGVSGEAGRITIREVSQAAGVSIKTVSRVLNKERHVKDETRQRVEEAARSLGFRPSSVARALAGRRSFQVALLCDNPSPYYINEVQTGAYERCVQGGFRLIFQPCDSATPTLVDIVVDLIEATHADGLILTPPIVDDFAVLEELLRRRVNFVRVAPGDDRAIAPSVMMDDVAAAREMTEYLISLGHRRIGFIVGHPAHSASGKRLVGYRAALAAHGIKPDPDLIQSGYFDFASGRAAATRLIALPDRPTAIFASNDDMAAGVVAVAHESGLGIPEDISIAGFDDTNIASMIWPPLTTVRQPMRELAYHAADLLLGNADASERRLLPHELVIRGTTARSLRALD